MDISCSEAQEVSAVASPVIHIGIVLIIIIALSIVGIVMKKYTNKVRAVVNVPMNEMVEKIEQNKILNQKP
jgi:hypothetical protein